MTHIDSELTCEPMCETEQDNIAPEVHPLEWDCPEKLKLLIEGAIFASQEPVTVKSIQVLFPELSRPNMKEIQDALTEIEAEYADRAVRLHKSTIGYRFEVRQSATPLVKSMLTEKPPKYSRASLETLALIAYRQPITRGEIEEVRGVSVSSQIMRTMEERGWIRVVGHKELPGRPSLWATTPEFLAYFGLNSLEELPPLAKIQSLDHDIFDVKTDTLAQKDVIIVESLAEESLPEEQKALEGDEGAPEDASKQQELDYPSLLQRLRDSS